jgi:hypothetical protein
MKKIILTFAILATGFASAQVGVGNTDPKATLDVNKASYTTGEQAGIAVTQQTAAQIEAMTTTDLKAGTLVYATTDTGTTINATGYWNWNGTTWVKTGSGSGKFVDGTNPLDAVYTTGKVGIGTATPNASSILDISTTSQGVLLPRMTRSQMTAISNPASGLGVWNTSEGGDLMFNIGTPAAPRWATSFNLTAGYSIQTDYIMGFRTNGGGFFSSSGLFYSGTGPSGFSYGTGLGSNGGYIFSDGGGFSISTFAPGSGDAVANKWSAFAVANNGNVGIGLGAPLAPLHIKAGTSNPTDVQEFRIASAANSANAKIGFKQRIGFYGKAEYGTGEHYNAGIEVLYGPNNHFPVFPGKSSTNMLFLTSDRGSGDAIERMRIDSNGNVGVGTTAPTVKLEVNGAIKVGNEATTTSAPTAGMIRFNTTTNTFEGYNGTSWITF